MKKHRIIAIAAIAAALLSGIGVYLARNPELRPHGLPQAVLRPFGQHTKPDWRAWVSTVAGDGLAGTADGAAATSRFSDPYGVAIARDGTVYVADGGDSNRIRRIAPDGTVSTLAGGREGYADGPAVSAAFDTPSGLALDGNGNLYVADTGNHVVRRIAHDGTVSTIAGNGRPGFADGKGAAAQFNGPVGVAVDRAGIVYVADTYNDRIRRIAPDGTVSTVAGAGAPDNADGPAASAGFDTPTALAVAADGTIYVADTGNNAIRKIGKDGLVSTFATAPEDERRPILHEPVGLALARDGYLYVACATGGRILQFAPDGSYHALLDADPAAADADVRLYGPRGLALERDGSLIAADAQAMRVLRLADQRAGGAQPKAPQPQALRKDPMPWPVSPQFGEHEVVGLMGEVRGSYDGESRDHFHGGLDIRADVGQPVLAVAPAKVTDPFPNWGFGQLGEGISVGALSYIHMRVGRDRKGHAVDPRFELLLGEKGKPDRVRVRRGTRFAIGDELGTVNAMSHVHLEYFPGGPKANPLALPFTGVADHIPPHIDKVALYDDAGKPLRPAKRGKPLLAARTLGTVHIVADAWDQMDGNLARRRLGLYKVGYQVLRADGSPLPGFEQPLITQVYNRLPRDREAVKVVYAPASGITVYGSKSTRFVYGVTNTLHDGQAAAGGWRIDAMAPGDYVLRIYAADYAGNVATAGRDLKLTIE
ncbi:hypothetical protein GCM10027321_45110 [Massilia terrae]|uniref:Gluconolaconase n=1 Tax=Massilia terrae TaxID=1811224 RepID=A0ABT2CSE0_9BURK|nr:gluconolaconase [Massilia terrae]MCS0656887.1 gluconolaconase [Massilia terrae]